VVGGDHGQSPRSAFSRSRIVYIRPHILVYN
jgi:hypothetical protein